MGRKTRYFTPVPAVSLDELVPADHFYRHVERVLDLAFVRDLVQDCYAAGGRPSVDPSVFFTLHLVMFFEDVRSERLLMRLVADRLSVRWFFWATTWMRPCPIMRVSPASVPATAWRSFAASSRRLSSSASKQEWSGAASSTSMRRPCWPRPCWPMRRLTRLSPALPWRRVPRSTPTWTRSSPTRPLRRNPRPRRTRNRPLQQQGRPAPPRPARTRTASVVACRPQCR